MIPDAGVMLAQRLRGETFMAQDNNPYRAPDAQVADSVTHSVLNEDIASGQKLVIYAILAYFLAGALKGTLGPVSSIICGLVVIAALFMALFGVWQLATGLGHPALLRLLWVILMFVPLVNLLTMVILSSMGTSRLRAAGYSVGLLGARR